LIDEFGNVLISFGEILVKFIDYHDSELFSLLDGLGLLDGRVKLPTLAGSLGFCILLIVTHV
jgi:membrane-associated HD superfamily phosphohydrolase